MRWVVWGWNQPCKNWAFWDENLRSYEFLLIWGDEGGYRVKKKMFKEGIVSVVHIEVEIFHAKFGHSEMKNNEIMTVLVIGGEREDGEKRVKDNINNRGDN